RGFVDATVLAALRPGAYVYNVGRGTTLDQDALLAALRAGHVAGAYLDVTDPEPLPADHALWRAPRGPITPHPAGRARRGAAARSRRRWWSTSSRTSRDSSAASRCATG